MNSLSEASLAIVEKVESHPNADRLDLIKIYGTPVICGRDEFELGETCVYIPFDNICPDDPNFPPSVRGKRVKATRIRGVFSMGLALKNKWSLEATDNVNEKLGITKYDWSANRQKGNGHSHIISGRETPPPQGMAIPSKYDLSSLRQHHKNLVHGEDVVIREKIHGTSSRFVYINGDMYVGSRNRWLERGDRNYWWRVCIEYGLEKKLKGFPNGKMNGIILYGEIFGSNVQDLTYNASPGQLLFSAFDLWNSRTGKFASDKILVEVCDQLEIPVAPEIYRGPWLGMEQHKHLAEQPSRIGGGLSEGFVVRPVQERHNKWGRVVYKLHGEKFLLR